MSHDRTEYDGSYGSPYNDLYGTEPYGADPYGEGAYAEPQGRQDAYEAAVDALADPLTDPLPGQVAAGPGAAGEGADFEPHTSPWFRPHQEQQPQQQLPPQAVQPRPQPQPQQLQPQPHQQPQPPQQPHQPRTAPSWAPGAEPEADPPRIEWGHTAGSPAPLPDMGGTAALPTVEPDPPAVRVPPRAARTAGADSGGDGSADDDRRTVGLRRPDDAELGRAARRKAAAKGGHSRGGRSSGGGRSSRARKGPPPAPLRTGTRLEARRAARAAKDGPVVILSRFIGEVFITLGVLMLLFVAYQLWWTNVLAHQKADKAANDLTDGWKEHPERRPDKFAAGEGFAIMYIPKLDIRVPVAEGVSKKDVLDKGMVGHYDKASGLDTAMPWDKKGNFSVAGHRNTHGEPFRYINKLVAGDEIIVETADTYYTYKMQSRLPSTSPSNTTVVEPVPAQSGFKQPGRYVTLTTCTPEFTSKFRLIVWGKMVEERPRSKGKPDALVG